jgi:copper(I)-binding protein
LAVSRRLLVAAMSGVLGLALAGCGAGQTAATSRDMSSAPGVAVTRDGIAVRNAHVEYSMTGYEAGADAPIQLVLLNETMEPVRLLQVSAPGAAATVTVTEAVQVGPAPADQQPAQPGETELELAPGALYAVTMQAGGLQQPLTGTGKLPLELTFDRGVVLTLTAPVAPPLDPLPRQEPIDVGHH